MKALKSYAETCGEELFDWNKALKKPISKYYPKELVELKNRARNWTTCACGNQCAIIPRSDEMTMGGLGAPLDEKLNNLGSFFYGAVCREDWSEAKGILKKIEARSLILIEKELKKLGSKQIQQRCK